MKKLIFAASFVFLLSIFSFGQETGRGLGLESGTSLSGELQSTVDVKKAKVGDQVVLKTTKAVKQNGETIIPKGSNLIGRITEVQQKTKQNGASRIGMVFDRVQGKNLSAPISASIVSITNAQAASSLGDTLDSGIAGSSTTSGRASSSGSGSSAGGGLLGGVTNTVGGVAGTATNTVGSVTNTAGQTVGSTVGTVGRTVNGIQISSAVSGSAQSSTTLSSPNNNIKLEKGVMFQLRFNKD